MFTGHISSDTDRIASPAAMRFRRHSVFGVQRLRDLSPRARLLYRRNGIRLAIPGTMVEAIGGRGDMKRAIWLALGLAIGFAAQRWTRTSVADLELRATEAWNRKDLDAAEKLSRQALGRDRHNGLGNRRRECSSPVACSLQMDRKSALTNKAKAGLR